MSVDTIERQAETAASAEEEASSAPVGRLRQAINPLRAGLFTAYEAAQEKSNQAIQGAENYVHRSPLKAVAYVAGIAVALGVLGGALLGRRSNNRRTGAGE